MLGHLYRPAQRRLLQVLPTSQAEVRGGLSMRQSVMRHVFASTSWTGSRRIWSACGKQALLKCHREADGE